MLRLMSILGIIPRSHFASVPQKLWSHAENVRLLYDPGRAGLHLQCVSRYHSAFLSSLSPVFAGMQSRATKYGHSCLICRRRKVRCDGGKPNCANCVRISERCIYNEHGSTITRLQNALSKSEQRLENLAQNLQGLLSLEPSQCQEQLRSTIARLHHGTSSAEAQSPSDVALATPHGTDITFATSTRGVDNHNGPKDDARTSDDGQDEEVGHSEVSVFTMLTFSRNMALNLTVSD